MNRRVPRGTSRRATVTKSIADAHRLHDAGRSGWWLLIGLIPLVGAIILIVLYCQDGQPGSNSHGPSPKGSTDPAGPAYPTSYGT